MPSDDRAGSGAAHPATRVILWVDLVLLVLAGSQLNIHPDQTGEFFAWVIGVTLTAAFLGAGYWVALPSLLLAVRTRTWRRVRVALIMALTLVTTELVVTVQDFEPFLLFDAPGMARAAAWIWVVGYFTLPPLNLAAILLNRGRGPAQPPERPMAGWAVGVLGAYALVLAVLGVGLLLFSGTFDSVWPWPVTKLTAGAISGWMFTLAAGCAWAVRERDWATFRIALPFYLLWFVAQLITAARFSDDLVDGPRPVVYFAALAGSLVVFAAIGWLHERGARAVAGA